MEHHLGRLIDHVHLVVADLDASKRFLSSGAAFARARSGAAKATVISTTDELYVSPVGGLHVARPSRFPGRRPRRRSALPRGGACRRRTRQRRAGRARLSPRLLRGVRTRSRRQQHRGRSSRTGATLGAFGRHHDAASETANHATFAASEHVNPPCRIISPRWPTTTRGRIIAC